MANDHNQCGFIGRLGADPEQRFIPAGDEVSNFRIACGWKTKAAEGTEWVPVVAYGKLAEICNKYLRKGSQVFIQGRFRTRKWQDKEGKDRYQTEIHCDQMQMLGGKQDQSTDSSAPAPRAAAPAKAPAPSGKTGSFDNFDDDIPFFEPCRHGGIWRVM